MTTGTYPRHSWASTAPGASPYPGLDLLATAVLLMEQGLVEYINPAAENLFAISSKHVVGRGLDFMFPEGEELLAAVHYALDHNCSFTEHEIGLPVPGQPLLIGSCTISPVESGEQRVLIEFRPMDQQRKVAQEERMLLQQQANRELIRNLAHEIKNPLGGIRGAAQLLEHELGRPELREYTQVIIKESDRLQALMDKLLAPHRSPQITKINIHEVLERVRSLVLAENSQGIVMRRDYDTSLPDLTGDKEQLIQVVLNIVRNAVQALGGKGAIVLRTRAARQVTLARKRHRLALSLQIIDNGPGIPESVREKMFYPLVSGREGGTGLGLTIAQTYVNQHQGTIDCESSPGRTCFTLMLPIGEQ